MQLTYRGQNYTLANTAVDMIDTGLTATFRGAAYSLQRATLRQMDPIATLTYRGVTYGVDSHAINPASKTMLAPSFG